MFDFHAHPGSDDKDAFISILHENEMSHITETTSIGLLPWLGSLKRERIEELIKNNNHLMLGEFGLDKVRGDIAADMDDFLFMADLARTYDRWAVIHSVRTNSIVFNELKKMKVKKAIFHSYTSSFEEAKEIMRAGYFISLSPRSFKTRDIDKLLSLDFLLESDMESGEEEKKVIAKLYEIAYEKTGAVFIDRLDDIKREIWKGSSYAWNAL